MFLCERREGETEKGRERQGLIAKGDEKRARTKRLPARLTLSSSAILPLSRVSRSKLEFLKIIKFLDSTFLKAEQSRLPVLYRCVVPTQKKTLKHGFPDGTNGGRQEEPRQREVAGKREFRASAFARRRCIIRAGAPP